MCLIGNPYNGYITPYYWVDDRPLLYGNYLSLDPGTYVSLINMFRHSYIFYLLHIPNHAQHTRTYC